MYRVLQIVRCRSTWNKKAKDVYNKNGHLVPFEVLKDEILAQELNYVKKEK